MHPSKCYVINKTIVNLPSVLFYYDQDAQGLRFFTARRYTSAVYAVVVCRSVCPSVCLSQVGVLPKMTTGRITQKNADSPGTLSLLVPKISAKFQRGHSQRGPQIEVFRLQSAICDQHLAVPYHRNGYCGMLIESLMRSIDWSYFRWL